MNLNYRRLCNIKPSEHELLSSTNVRLANMNYRHLYHAGNFADVVKHVILIELAHAMQRKPKGFCYVDTHAGIGRYDLKSVQAKKTAEYSRGIVPVLQALDAPQELQAYLNIIKAFNPSSAPVAPQFYPGSPCIIQKLMRAQDRMILNELHPEDYQLLRYNFYLEPRAAVHHRDAYELLLALLPLVERRGLILIDPAYEKTDELDQVHLALQKALKRFATGIYTVWIPIKDRSYRKFSRALAASTGAEILLVELTLAPVPHKAEGLVGAAMLIINPPFQIQKVLQAQLSWLWKLWGTAGKGGWKIETIR